MGFVDYGEHDGVIDERLEVKNLSGGRLYVAVSICDGTLGYILEPKDVERLRHWMSENS